MNKFKSFIKYLLVKIGVDNKTIDYIYFDIYKNQIETIKNYLLYKLAKKSQIEYILKRKVLINKERFGDNNFYQSYPPLNFTGDRDTLQRFTNYELSNYIDKDKEILDIGGNLCFFSLYTSRFVKHIDVVEYNPNLADIGKTLQVYEKIENVSIINMDFKLYNPSKQYDIIFSFAIHMWVGLPFRDYLEKIHGLLIDGGILFLESQDLRSDPFLENLDIIKDLYETISIKDSNDHLENYRKIAILKKI